MIYRDHLTWPNDRRVDTELNPMLIQYMGRKVILPCNRRISDLPALYGQVVYGYINVIHLRARLPIDGHLATGDGSDH